MPGLQQVLRSYLPVSRIFIEMNQPADGPTAPGRNDAFEGVLNNGQHSGIDFVRPSKKHESDLANIGESSGENVLGRMPLDFVHWRPDYSIDVLMHHGVGIRWFAPLYVLRPDIGDPDAALQGNCGAGKNRL